MKKTNNHFKLLLGTFCALAISACATQEPAPIEYGSSPSGAAGASRSRTSSLLGAENSDKIASKSFKEEEKEEQGNFLRDKNSDDKPRKKYVTEEAEEEEDPKPVAAKKQKKVEEERDIEAELDSIEDEQEEVEKKPTKKEEVKKEENKKEETVKPAEIQKPAEVSERILQMPTNGEISDKYGAMIDGVSNPGINIAAKLGSPVVAASSGIVTVVKEAGKYGKLVIIKHSTGNLQTAYAHLGLTTVSKGQNIKAGEEIGTVGQTGDAKKPMLHFAVKANNATVDPEKYLKED